MLKAQIIGYLGRDGVVNNANGKSVINFSVAHTETWKDLQTGEKKSSTIWMNCSYFTDKTAIAPYLKKGTQVYVEGKPTARAYTSNGQNYASLELQVQKVQLLGGNNQESHQSQPAQQSMPQHPAGFEPVNNVENPADDLPF